MSLLDWVIIVGCWMLIPAVLGLKMIMDYRDAKSEKKLRERLN